MTSLGEMTSLDDLDAAALQYALVAIDDWNIETASLLDEHEGAILETPPLSPLATNRSVVATPYQKRPHHATRKHVLLELRAQVESLQRALAQEQRTVWSTQFRQHTLSESAALQRECQEMATRQSHARFVAQMHNKALRKLTDEYRRSAIKIERLGSRMLSRGKVLPRNSSLTSFDGPREAPQIQLLRLPGLQHEAARMFSSGAFAEHKNDRLKTFREVALRDSRSSHGLVEVVFETAWVLPFAIDDVADALWQQTTRVTTGNNEIQWLDVHAEASSVVSQFVSVSTDDTNPSTKCGQIATHRARVNNGMAQLVSNVQVKAMNGAAGFYSSDVWARVKAISSADDCPLTQVLWCRRVRLQPPKSQWRSLPERTQWMYKVLSGSTGTLRAREESMLTGHMQAVENLLVNASAKAKRDAIR